MNSSSDMLPSSLESSKANTTFAGPKYPMSVTAWIHSSSDSSPPPSSSIFSKHTSRSSLTVNSMNCTNSSMDRSNSFQSWERSCHSSRETVPSPPMSRYLKRLPMRSFSSLPLNLWHLSSRNPSSNSRSVISPLPSAPSMIVNASFTSETRLIRNSRKSRTSEGGSVSPVHHFTSDSCTLTLKKPKVSASCFRCSNFRSSGAQT
mmetsp:Transcript_111752/g.326784  ORF Transcript_111752/g.326784 Transcript_111752/m.326784 type:complete len:204 (+) Transcript_111752:124-735(+)